MSDFAILAILKLGPLVVVLLLVSAFALYQWGELERAREARRDVWRKALPHLKRGSAER